MLHILKGLFQMLVCHVVIDLMQQRCKGGRGPEGVNTRRLLTQCELKNMDALRGTFSVCGSRSKRGGGIWTLHALLLLRRSYRVF